MKREGDVIYVYDGTFDGFLSCVFEAFYERESPVLVSKRDKVQMALGTEIKKIATDPGHADRVYNGILKKLGGETLKMVHYATLSAEEDAEAVAISYLKLGFRAGRRIYGDLTNQYVWRMNKVARLVGNEVGRYLEFLRFSELEGGILFGEFEPSPHVLPMIMPHFADRLSAQPFIIHDIGRRLAGVYDTRDWYIVSSEDMELPRYSEDEQAYRALWKLFFNTIAIKERINPRLQMQHVPKKYWKYLTEMRQI